MSINRPHEKKPEVIYQWLLEEQDPDAIYQYLNELRHENYAHHIRMNHPIHAVVHALTTNNIWSIDPHKLKMGIADIKPYPQTAAIVEALTVVYQYLCKHRHSPHPLIAFTGHNPFANFPGMCVSDVNLSTKDFQWANFRGATFKNVILTSANLSLANFTCAKFKNVNCENAVVNGATFQDATLEANLQNCDFSNANLSWARLQKSTNLSLPVHINLKNLLQIDYPGNNKLNDTLSVENLLDTLNTISLELKQLREIKDRPIKGEHARLKQHHYDRIVANNITKLSTHISDTQAALNLLMAAINHPLFSDHHKGRFSAHLSHAVEHAHRFFCKADRLTPYFGSIAQDKMIHQAREFEKQLHSQHAVAKFPSIVKV